MGGMSALSGVAGAMGSNKSSTSGINLSPASALQNQLGGSIQNDYNSLSSYINAGPGLSDVQGGYDSQKELAELLRQYSEGGYNPNGNDINTANSQASNLFRGQQVGLDQAFEQQSIDANRQAALMGRAGNDPILAAKLAQEKTRQQAQLSANQGSLAQQLAMNAPQQRLGYATDRTNIMSGLASQAMANRQALLSMGSNMQANERNYQLATSNKWGNESSGGGLGGMLTGAISGFGAGASAVNSFSGANLNNNLSQLIQTGGNQSGYNNYLNMMKNRQPGTSGPYGGPQYGRHRFKRRT